MAAISVKPAIIRLKTPGNLRQTAKLTIALRDDEN
jgi:hypothetical protein